MVELNVRQIPMQWYSHLPIFASEAFMKLVSDEYGWLGGFDNTDELRCILPYTVMRKAKLRMVRFRVQTIPVGEGLNAEQEKAFLKGSIEHFRLIRADMVIPASNTAIFQTYPEGALAAPYGTFIIDLNKREEILWSNIHSKHRNSIRNAIKNGVEIRSGLQYLDTAYELVHDTLKRSSLSFIQYNAFKRIVLGLTGNIQIFVAYHQGSVQGCAIIPYSAHSAYYWYGGSISDLTTGSMNLLQWEAIRFFNQIGTRHYDFVGVRINPERGSKQYGLMMFKKRFGGQLVNGYMWKCPINEFKFAIYSAAVRILRGGDVVDLEHHKLSHRLPYHCNVNTN